MSAKILIIGRGLSGSILSLKMHSLGINHDIIDEPSLSQSSRIAAGVVNPIVLKRLNLVKDAHSFIPAARHFYEKWESELSAKFYHPLPIKHVLQSIGEINQWLEKGAHETYMPYLKEIIKEVPDYIHAPLGFGLVQNTAWLDTKSFLNLHANLNTKAVGSIESKEVTQPVLSELCKRYEHVVVCTGHTMKNLLPETKGAYAPTRGEVMTIESKDLPQDAIYHGPVFILPLGNKLFKVGATYHRDKLQDEPSSEGLNTLNEKLGKIFTGDYKVVEHKAGVRPNTKDRRPLLGHVRENIYSFNGMGSRAVLMAPYLADLLLNNLFEGKSLPQSYNIKRYL